MTKYEAELKIQENSLKKNFSLYDQIKIKIKEHQDIINDKQSKKEDVSKEEAEMNKLVNSVNRIVSSVRKIDNRIDMIKDIIKKSKKEDVRKEPVGTIKSSIDAISELRSKIEGLKDTIMNIAPELPTQGNIIQDITTTLNEFQTNFIETLDSIYSDVEKELLGEK